MGSLLPKVLVQCHALAGGGSFLLGIQIVNVVVIHAVLGGGADSFLLQR